MPIALAAPSAGLFDSWAATVTELGSSFLHGAGLERGTVPTREACEALIARATLAADPDAELPEGQLRCDYFWITDDDEVVGFIAFRHELTEWLRQYGGHIGSSIRPSRRRQGIAGAALALVLEHARSQGFERVMLTCDDTNVASYSGIERAGGVLHATVDGPGEYMKRVRQYWIEL